MKRILSFMLAVVLCFSLAACGSGGAGTATGSRIYEYFDEMPKIPTPDSAFGLEIHPMQVANGKAYYLSRTSGPNDTQTVLLNYLTLLSECGFGIRPSDGGYVVSLQDQDCMTVQLNANVIKVIFPDPAAVGNGTETIEMPTPVVLVDNQYCRVELLRLRKVTGPGNHPVNPNRWEWQDNGVTFYADLQFYNNYLHEYTVQSELYLENEGVLDLTRINGSNTAPDPGKSGIMEIQIARWDGSKELPMELEDLYRLNGAFSFHAGGMQGVSVSFDFAEALGR